MQILATELKGKSRKSLSVENELTKGFTRGTLTFKSFLSFAKQKVWKILTVRRLNC